MASDAEIRERLATYGRLADNAFPIGEVALCLAHRDLPNARIERYTRHLESICEHVASASKGATTLRDHVGALRDVLFRFHGYAGDEETYEDTQNANLMRVIDRRKGLPVALGVLVLNAMRTQDWQAKGLTFPGHFVIRLDLRGEKVILDPFAGLRRLAADDLARLLERVHGRKVALRAEFIRSVSDRDVLLRLQNNIKSRALAQRDFARAIQVLDSMVLIAPGNGGLVDELAGLQARYKGSLH